MRRLTVLAAAAVALAVVPASSAKPPKLIGTVGPGFTISLKKPSGASAKTLKPGTYTLVVTDKSSSHDFHLTGPGVNKVVTTVLFTGKKTATLKLKRGKYSYVCDPHRTFMKGSFTVTR